MYCVIFRFTLAPVPDAEARFMAAWTGITQFFQDHAGALDSHLHKSADGHFVSTAYWPDAQHYAASHDIPRDQAFIAHAITWSEVCTPTEVLFEGPVVSALNVS